MSAEQFRSGPWTGFYNYLPGDKHRMDLHLRFSGGILQGDGVDDVGRFTIRGQYDAGPGECYWTKTYLGGHDVFYRGFREGKGIWGTWEIGAATHGGFHIWPMGEKGDHGEEAEAAEAEPVDVIGQEVEVTERAAVKAKLRVARPLGS